MSTPRPPAPGPSFVPEAEFTPRGSGGHPRRSIRLGMTAPTTAEDGWWLAVLFARDEAGIVAAEDVTPAGPPPGPPLRLIGPAFAGALAGFVAQDGGRQQLRMALPPPPDEQRPWSCPLLVRLAVRWEPMRALSMRPDELAREVLLAFRRSLEAAGSPW